MHSDIACPKGCILVFTRLEPIGKGKINKAVQKDLVPAQRDKTVGHSPVGNLTQAILCYWFVVSEQHILLMSLVSYNSLQAVPRL